MGRLGSRLAADAKSDKDEIKRLERLLKESQQELADARACKFSLPTGKKTKSTGKSFCRVIVPDSHGCFIDGPAAGAFLDDLERIEPAEIVLLGDHLDCGGFLAQHHVAHYVAQAKYRFADDVAAANAFLDEIQLRAPLASFHYIEGNHERRIETFIITATLRNDVDAEFLRSMFSAPIVLNIGKRGIRYYPQGQYTEGQEIPGILQLGKCRFMHGEFTSKNAAKAHVDEYACNLVYGHTHRADSYMRRSADATYGAWNPGCLAIRQQYWNHSRITHHTQGYGLQVVQADGGFLHINVPIIDGVSYLKPLANHLNRG